MAEGVGSGDRWVLAYASTRKSLVIQMYLSLRTLVPSKCALLPFEDVE